MPAEQRTLQTQQQQHHLGSVQLLSEGQEVTVTTQKQLNPAKWEISLPYSVHDETRSCIRGETTEFVLCGRLRRRPCPFERATVREEDLISGGIGTSGFRAHSFDPGRANPPSAGNEIRLEHGMEAFGSHRYSNREGGAHLRTQAGEQASLWLLHGEARECPICLCAFAIWVARGLRRRRITPVSPLREQALGKMPVVDNVKRGLRRNVRDTKCTNATESLSG